MVYRYIYKRSIIFYTALSAFRTLKRKDTSWGLGDKFLNVFFGGVDHAGIAPGITFSFCSFLAHPLPPTPTWTNMLRASWSHHCVHKLISILGRFLRYKGRDRRREIVKTESLDIEMSLDVNMSFILSLITFMCTTFEQNHNFRRYSYPVITLIYHADCCGYML